MKKIKLLTLVLAFLANAAYADIYDDIGNAIRSGDAKQVTAYFGSNVDLTLSNQEDVYSRAQAEQLIRDFLSKNPPRSFTVVHKGSSREGTLFAVGNLVTSSGKTFRTSFTLKNNQGKYIIQELRFEAQ
jgi:hypothetical protein